MSGSARLFIRILISVLVLGAFLLHIRGDMRIGLLDELERIAYDARLLVSMPRTGDDLLVIIDIDEKSLSEEGHWPWPRERLAELVDTLFEDHGIAVLAFDMAFPEPSRNTDAELIDALLAGGWIDDPALMEELSGLRGALDRDARFAESLAGRPTLAGFVFRQNVAEDEPREIGQLPPPVLPDALHDTDIEFPAADGYTGNIGVLQEAAMGGGFYSNPRRATDPDGSHRRIGLLQEYDGRVYEALSLAVVRTLLGQPPIEFRFQDDGAGNRTGLYLDWLDIGGMQVPVDEHMAALVPYRGGPFTFDYVSASDVLHGRVEADRLAGRVALLGTSAPGLLDLRVTPVSSEFPGVEVHANMISGILGERLMSAPPEAAGYLVVLALVVTVLLTWAMVMLAPAVSTGITVAALAAIIGIDTYAWNNQLVLPLAAPLSLVAVLFLLHMTWGFFIEARQKRHLSKLFGQYIPPELVDELDEDPDSFTLEGESRDMTVMFSDVRGFTTLSEGLEPQELTQLMNEFLTPLTRVIHEHRGTIDKYMGDAVMAFWGAPLPDDAHPRNAVAAALAMQAAMHALRERFVSRGWPAIRIGVGISSGPMSVGNMGSEFRMAYTVIGDSVNLGSRLEGLTTVYGAGILVSDTTRDRVPDYVFRRIDRVRVKGKDKPVEIYQPLGPEDAVDNATLEEVAQLEEAIAAYRGQRWHKAARLFAALEAAHPDTKLYALYRERVDWYRENPPGEDWDGAFTHSSK